jgi:hypothetical protein
MNYKEKIFIELMMELKKKKLQAFHSNNLNQDEKEHNNESANIVNLFPLNASNSNYDNSGLANFLENISNKKPKYYLFISLIAKYYTEISIILKFFLKCLLNNYKCDDSHLKFTCIKPEIKELILRCKLAKTIETFIGLIIKDEIKFEIDIISEFYDKPYLEELYKYSFFGI